MSESPPPWIRIRAAGVEVQVKVVPRSSRQGIAGELGDRLKVLLHAPPVEGEANRALLEVMANAAGVPVGRVSIAAGVTGRSKTVLIRTDQPEATAQNVRRAAGRIR